MKKLCGMIIAVTLGTWNVLEAGVIVNPGFETGNTNGWVMGTANGVNEWSLVSGSAAHDGLYALMCQNAALTLKCNSILNVPSSQVSDFSFWVFTNTDTAINLSLVYYTNGTTVFENIHFLGTPDGWTHIDATPYLDSDKGFNSFFVQSTGTGSSYRVIYDSFSLVVVPEPPVLLLSLFGVACLPLFTFLRSRKELVLSRQLRVG